ncbi:MAG: hypothetical protein M1530_02510 [Candidatus Marsarchaeota archaeon]|nr:hypothetical protein [Candidatus Marsarchaeota archaeon]
MKKAQAGLDFLMTYGWALLLIVLIVGALFAMGIFDVGSFLGSRSSGFAQIKPIAWRVDGAGALTLKLQNNAGTSVNVTNISATLNGETISNATVVSLSNGRQSGTLPIGAFSGAPSSGSSYSVQVQITYLDRATSFVYNDAGTITGRAG